MCVWSAIALSRVYNCVKIQYGGLRKAETGLYHLWIRMVISRNASLVVIGDWDTANFWDGEGLIEFIASSGWRCSEKPAGDEGSGSGSTDESGPA